MVQNTAILAKNQVQYKCDQRDLYYGLDTLPKSTTVAVSVHAQWQIRQKWMCHCVNDMNLLRDVTMTQTLHVKGSTCCQNVHRTSHNIITRSGLKIFVYIKCILTKLCCKKLARWFNYGRPCIINGHHTDLSWSGSCSQPADLPGETRLNYGRPCIINGHHTDLSWSGSCSQPADWPGETRLNYGRPCIINGHHTDLSRSGSCSQPADWPGETRLAGDRELTLSTSALLLPTTQHNTAWLTAVNVKTRVAAVTVAAAVVKSCCCCSYKQHISCLSGLCHGFPVSSWN